MSSGYPVKRFKQTKLDFAHKRQQTGTREDVVHRIIIPNPNTKLAVPLS